MIQRHADIVPLEVKSGTKGAMQSLSQFLSKKGYTYGIRCSMENFGSYQNIMVFPLYAVHFMFSKEFKDF